MPTKKTPASHTPSEADVAAYLVKNPDFLVRHTDVLDQLLPPERTLDSGVSDFQRYFVDRLKGQLESLKERQETLLANGYANDVNLSRIHASVLRIMDAESLEALGAIIRDDVAALCELDAATLAMEGSTIESIRPLPKGQVERWLGPADTSLCASCIAEPLLFGLQAAHIHSFALLRLDLPEGLPPVVIAFGHKDPEWFTPDQSTDLISFMVGALARRFVQLTA